MTAAGGHHHHHHPHLRNPREGRVTPFLVKAAAIACLGGILFGYDLGVISGALPSLTRSLDLTNGQAETVVSFLYLGSIVGSVVGGIACDRFGRRTAILFTDALFLLGSIVLASANGYGSVLFGRVTVGIAVGVSALADVSYLTEIAPDNHRGALVSCNEASISVGFLLAYVCSYGITVSVENDDGWRIMFGMSGLIAVLQWCCMLGLPESPVWLDDQGREAEAKRAMRLIHGPDVAEIAAELELTMGGDGDAGGDGQAADRKPDSESRAPVPHEHSPISHYWRQFVIAAFLAVSQQFCGHINILNFAPEIFSQVFYGAPPREGDSILLATNVILGGVKLVITLLVIWEVDTLGRRFLLLGGTSLIAISLVFLVAAFSGEVESTAFGPSQKALALLGCTGIVAGYAMSYGPLTWLLTSEMFPAHVRGRTIGAATVLTHASAMLISYTFLTGQEWYGPAAPFEAYLAFGILSLVFAFLAVPDTGSAEAGGDGEDVDEALDDMWFWRRVCRCGKYRSDDGKGKPQGVERTESGFADAEEELPTPSLPPLA